MLLIITIPKKEENTKENKKKKKDTVLLFKRVTKRIGCIFIDFENYGKSLKYSPLFFVKVE